MASRALAAAATGPDDYARDLRARARPARAPGDPALARPDVRPRARRLLGRRRPRRGGGDDARRDRRRTATKVDGVKVSLLDHEREIAVRRALPDGVRLYTGDDFNYPELIRGDEHGLLGRAARDLRRDRARRGRGARRARRRRHRPLRRDPRADRPALAPHLPRADVPLQDRHRVPRLPQRPPAPLPHGRRAGERALDHAPGRAVRAGRRRRAAARSGAGRRRRMRGVLELAGVDQP